VVAEGQFGGVNERENFVIDTGTSPSIINTRIAKQLALSVASGQETGIAGKLASNVAILPELKIGPIHAISLPVFVMDLSRLERDLGIPIAGQLGLDVLARTSFRLDYKLKVLEFGEVDQRGVPIPVDSNLPIAVLPVIVAGKSIRLLVDSGTDRLVVFGRRTGQPLPEPFSVQGREARMAAGLTIETPSVNMLVDGSKYSVEKAYLIPRSEDALFDGLVGVRALGFLAITFDLKSHTVYLLN